MSGAGQRIIDALQDAVAGNFARVTVEGTTWIRQEQLDAERDEATLVQSKLADEIDRLGANLETLQKTNADLCVENEALLEAPNARSAPGKNVDAVNDYAD